VILVFNIIKYEYRDKCLSEKIHSAGLLSDFLGCRLKQLALSRRKWVSIFHFSDEMSHIEIVNFFGIEGQEMLIGFFAGGNQGIDVMGYIHVMDAVFLDMVG